jgi:hypothetical protein
MAWERLAHTELSSAGDDIDTSTFTAKKSLRVLVHIQDSGTCNVKMRFNGFSDQSYSTKYGESGANDGSSTSATFIRCYEVGSGTNVQRQMTFEITNISDKEKHILGHTVESESTGASSIPKRVELAGKFDKTNQQINRIQLVNDASGSFGSGSYITVLGAKEPATANVMTVSGMTAKKNLMIQAKVKGGNGNTFTFNNDTGNNYAHRYSNNGGSDGTQTSRANLWSYYDGNDTTKFTTLYVVNEASKEKLIITENVSAVGTGAGTAPQRTETTGKWANTSNAITRVDVGTFTTNGIEEGSEVVVWGSDGASDTTHPTIVNGFILEETDTGKHYIWNATTSTWTEIA